jgi:hypothetical protein
MSVPSSTPASVLLLDLATALTLSAALVYAAGWTYAYHYFGNFSLGLLMLDIPVRYYFGSRPPRYPHQRQQPRRPL